MAERPSADYACLVDEDGGVCGREECPRCGFHWRDCGQVGGGWPHPAAAHIGRLWGGGAAMSTDGLVAALARAQATFGPIDKAKRAEAGKYGYSYADIADVLAEVRPKLAAEGIAVLQPIRVTGAGMVLVTQLRKGDDVIESEMLLPIEGQAPQQVGSLCTYYRRYALCALVGVAPENEDDDGAAAQQTVSHGASRAPAATAEGRPASEAQVRFATTLLNEVIPTQQWLEVIAEHGKRQLASIDDIAQLAAHEISPLIEWLKQAKKGGRTKDDFVYPEGEPPFMDEDTVAMARAHDAQEARFDVPVEALAEARQATRGTK